MIFFQLSAFHFLHRFRDILFQSCNIKSSLQCRQLNFSKTMFEVTITNFLKAHNRWQGFSNRLSYKIIFIQVR